MLRVYLVPARTTYRFDDEGNLTDQIASVGPDVPDGTAMVAQQTDEARFLVMTDADLQGGGIVELLGDVIPDDVQEWSLYGRRLADNGMA